MTVNAGPGAITGWLRLHGTESDLAGCVFLVSPEIVLTCAHVVGAHLGLSRPVPSKLPTEAVTIRFESLRAEVVGRVLAGGWFSNAPPQPGALSDIAVIRLDKPIEAISSVPTIAPRMPTISQQVLIHGAESDYKSYGQQVSGYMSGSNIPRGWRQINPTNSARGFTVKNGFSGSPVLDELGNIIWGMIVAVAEEPSGVAYAIPADDLFAALKSAYAESPLRSPGAEEQVATKTMSEILEHIRENEFAIGRQKLIALEERSGTYSEALYARVLYNRACLESAYAEELPQADRPENEAPALALSLRYLKAWLEMGLAGAWSREGKTPRNEIYRMGCDSDLWLLLSKERASILASISEEYRDALPRSLPTRRSSGGGGGGCVPGFATVHTPTGMVAVDLLREGDEIYSFELRDDSRQVTARIVKMHAKRASECVLLNERFYFTADQPLYRSADQLILAGNVEVGMELLGCAPNPIIVTSKTAVFGYRDVYNLTTDHDTHNYAAYDGVICHNDKG